MEETNAPVQFTDGGFIDFTPPKGATVIIWLIGMLLVGYGVVNGFNAVLTGEVAAIAKSAMASVIGSMIVIGCTPTRLQVEYDKIRRSELPRDFQIRSEGSANQSSFWTGTYTDSPTTDDRGWVFDAPGPEYWDVKDKYSADHTGILTEHPSVIGTPQPATISAVGIFGTIIALYAIPATFVVVSVGIVLPWTGEEFDFVKILMMFGPVFASLIIAVTSFQTAKRMQATIDIPTSKIRSLAAGELELVGQVRRWSTPAPTVQVGGDASRSIDDLHAWRWKYEIYIRRKEVYMTKKGPRTRTVYQWRTIQNQDGNHPFILHDGTGGVLVRPNTFSFKEFGQYMRRWEVPHNKNLSSLFGSILSTALVGETLLKHRWTLWGLSLGDPCYILGKAIPRPNEELKEEKFWSRGQNILVQIHGEDAPQFEARLERGSELGVLAKVRSQFEYRVIPPIIFAGALAATVMAFQAAG